MSSNEPAEEKENVYLTDLEDKLIKINQRLQAIEDTLHKFKMMKV